MGSKNSVEFTVYLDPDGVIRGSKQALAAWKTYTKQMEDSARQSGLVIEKAYENIGVRSFKSIRAEIELVRASYRALEKSGRLSSQELSRAAKSTQARIRQLRNEMKATEAQSGSMGAAFATAGRQLAVASAAIFSSQTALRLIKITDEWNVLQQRIKTATKETGEYNAVSEDLYRITLRNGTAMRTTVSVFQSLARSASELRATNSEVLAVTEAVQQLGVISGASNTAMSAGLLQFSQALAGGVVRAEEMNSLLENIPEVANRIAKGMGLTVGELRTAVLAGEVLSKDVFEALLKQTGQIREEFEAIPPSIERSINSLGTAFAKLLGQIDETVGATSFIADRIQNLTTKIDNSRGNLLLLAAEFSIVGDQVSEYLTNVYDEQDLKRQNDVFLKTIEEMKDAINSLDEEIGQTSLRAAALGPLDTPERRELLEEMDKLKEKREELFWLLQDYIQGLDQAKKKGVESAALTKDEIDKLNGSLKDVGNELERVLHLYDKQVTKLEASKQAARDLAKSFKDVYDEISQQGGVEQKLSILDIAAQTREAQRALNAGDFEEAAKAAEKSRDMIQELAREGENSRVVLLGLLGQAEKVAEKASQGQIQKDEAELANIQEKILSLIQEAAVLQNLKVGFDEEEANQNAKKVREDLQGYFEQNPLKLPAEIFVKNAAGDVDASKSLDSLPVPGKAGGGRILGPGTETSDSILIRASRNEFMQPAASVRLYGLDVMEELRHRRIDPALLRRAIYGYRTGGLIRELPPSAQVLQSPRESQMSSRATFVIQLNGKSYTAQTDPGTASELAREARLASAKGGKRGL